MIPTSVTPYLTSEPLVLELIVGILSHHHNVNEHKVDSSDNLRENISECTTYK